MVNLDWRKVGGRKDILSIRSEVGVRGRAGEVQKSGLHCPPRVIFTHNINSGCPMIISYLAQVLGFAVQL